MEHRSLKELYTKSKMDEMIESLADSGINLTEMSLDKETAPKKLLFAKYRHIYERK